MATAQYYGTGRRNLDSPFFSVPGTATSLLMAARSMNTSVEKWRE